MKLLFDQNLSSRLPRLLADIFPDSAHVRELGMRNSTDTVLAKIQCPADVRYGQVPVSLSEAVDAHQAAISVCAEASKNL